MELGPSVGIAEVLLLVVVVVQQLRRKERVRFAVEGNQERMVVEDRIALHYYQQ